MLRQGHSNGRSVISALAVSPVAGSHGANNLTIGVVSLRKCYDDVPAVRDINFGVERGKFLGFLWPNGADKTITVSILTGIIQPDGGNGLVMGYSAGSLQAKQLSGTVSEMANPYLYLSRWDNLMLMAELYEVPLRKARENAENYLQALWITAEER